MLKLTPAERSALRSEAHALHPVVMIGEAGLTPSVLKEIDVSLNAHGLIKVRVFGDERDDRIAIYEAVCEQLGAAPIQHIGKLLVFYRPKKEASKERSEKRGKGMREETIVTPRASGSKRPTETKEKKKENERETTNRTNKHAKPRQKCHKISALGGL